MGSPVGGANQGTAEQELKARIRTWIREELANAARGGIGLHVDGATGNLIIDRGQEQSGNYVPGTSGWALFPNGNAEFSGAVTIDGSLTIASGLLRGITFLQTATNQIGVNNYAITTTSTARSTMSFTAPAGFTQANVITVATAMGFNSSGSSDFLYVQSVINGVGGGELYTSAPAGASVGVSNPFFTVLSGLSAGAVVTTAVATRTGFNTWGASTANQANIYAMVVWSR